MVLFMEIRSSIGCNRALNKISKWTPSLMRLLVISEYPEIRRLTDLIFRGKTTRITDSSPAGLQYDESVRRRVRWTMSPLSITPVIRRISGYTIPKLSELVQPLFSLYIRSDALQALATDHSEHHLRCGSGLRQLLESFSSNRRFYASNPRRDAPRWMRAPIV